VEDLRLIVDLVLALAAALLGGAVARMLGQPVLVGYLVAGIAIGPHTPGFVADNEQVVLLANLGVALLMFALGVEFRLSHLSSARRASLITGAIQIPVTILLGFGAGVAIGWPKPAAVVLGCAFAISSSIVALKLLMGAGETGSLQARMTIGLSIVQDLSLVPILALLPLLAGGEEDFLGRLVRSLIVATLALGAVMLVGTRIVPPVLATAARTGSREIFLLSVVVIGLGTAVLVHEAGLSVGLGAFLAGLVVSESEFQSQVLADIIPLRDIFASLFFVAIGMLIDPAQLVAAWPTVLFLLAVLVIGKLLVIGGSLLAAGTDHRTAALTASLMSQMGEFSFVIAGVALFDQIISDDQYRIIIIVATGSILLSPVLNGFGPRLVKLAEYLPGVQARDQRAAGPEPLSPELSGHVVLCGYGRVGAELGSALAAAGREYAVIELNPGIVRKLREQGIWAHYGDAASAQNLSHVGIERARVLAVTTPDMVTAEGAIRVAKLLNPAIRTIARATSPAVVGIVSSAGADEVVQPEFEAGLEFVRQVLDWEDVDTAFVSRLVADRRVEVYGNPDITALGDPGKHLPA
jgi:monovalent cation:H+ antiporter-2, CPA2 family